MTAPATPTAAAPAAPAPSPAPRPPRRLPSDPKLAARVAAVEDEEVDDVRRSLAAAASPDPSATAAVAAFLTGDAAEVDDTINAFLRAAAGDVATASKRLASTLAWRAAARPHARACAACAADPTSHHMFIAGEWRGEREGHGWIEKKNGKQKPTPPKNKKTHQAATPSPAPSSTPASPSPAAGRASPPIATT